MTSEILAEVKKVPNQAIDKFRLQFISMIITSFYNFNETNTS